MGTRISSSLAAAALLALMLGSLIVAAGGSTSFREGLRDGRVVVAVTLPPLAWVVKFIGGPFVSVYSVIPPEVDPHEYEPPASTLVEELGRAELIVITGPSHLPIEVEIKELVREGLIKAKLISYRDYVANGLRLLKNPLTGKVNPHGYMFSLNGLKAIAEAVAKELSVMDPKHSWYYEGRMNECLEMLEKELASLKSMLPPNVRVGLTAPPLQYVVSELGLNTTFMLLPDPTSKVTQHEVNELIHAVRTGEVKVMLISDFIAKERPRLLALYRSLNVTYIIVPVRKLWYEPTLIPAVLVGELRSVAGNHGLKGIHGEVSACSLLTPIIIAESFIIILLILLLTRYRRVVRDALLK